MAGAQIEKWPTSGRIGSITSAVVGVPNASERGAKSEVGWPGVGGCAHGGATTNVPDATHPLSHLSKLGGRRGGRGSWGGRVGEGIGGTAGGVPKRGGGGCARPTTTTCMPRGGMCVWGYGEQNKGQTRSIPFKGSRTRTKHAIPPSKHYTILLLHTIAVYCRPVPLVADTLYPSPTMLPHTVTVYCYFILLFCTITPYRYSIPLL